MTPLQVEFCYQVAHGNVKQAQALLPQMNGADSLFEGTRTPAVFCLWAAKQPDRELVLAKLAELYPSVSAPVASPTHQRVSIEETVCEVLVPAIRPHMHRLFSSIVNATPQKIRADYAKAGFEIISCAAALQFILSHQAFKDNADNWKKLTTQMLQQLLALTKEQLEMTEHESSPLAHPAPDSVKALLKQTTPPSARFSTLFPGLGNHSTQEDVTEEIEQENNAPLLPKLGASPKGFFTSRPLYGRQSLPHDLTTNVHAFSSAALQQPPIPSSVQKVLLHQPLDLVATNPLLKPRSGH